MSNERVPQVDDVTFGESSIGMPPRRDLSVGEMVDGVVVSAGDGNVFVDIGAKSEGVIDAKEVTDADGNLTVSVGDALRACVVEVEPEIVLSYGIARANLDARRLQDAYEAALPVEGKVTGVNKGGLDVSLGGTRAFCPMSQIEAGYCEDPSIYLDQTLRFRIARYEQDGRNVVVSRRALLEEERAEQAAATREQLREGVDIDGVVKRLQPFGAFVDIGGVEGLLHVSEISHARVEDPAELLSVGQRVRVRVKKIERDPKDPRYLQTVRGKGYVLLPD